MKLSQNIINRFFTAIASFWSNAAKYQIFIILAAIALIAISPLFSNQLDNGIDVIFNIIIFCTIAAAGFLLFRLRCSSMVAFTFAIALFLRICLALFLEGSTPFMLEYISERDRPWVKHYDSVLLDVDEFFYVYQGQRYEDVTTSEFIKSPAIKDHSYRSGFLMSRLFLLFGDEFVWVRFLGAFLGAFAAAIVVLAAEELFRRNTVAIVSLLCAVSPQTVFYSVRLFKEVWIIFAVSIMIFGLTKIIRNKNSLSVVLPIIIAITILFWVRFEYGLLFIVALPVATYFRDKSSYSGKFATIILTAFLGMIIIFCYFDKFTQKAEDMMSKYTLMERGQRGNLEKVETLDSIYKSRGPLRLLNIPLSGLNPPPKNLHHIYTEQNRINDIMLLSNIYQWWIPLPFLLIGAMVIVKKQMGFLAFLLPYIVAICVSAILLGGLEPNLLRYRDSLAPIAFIITGVGIESYLTLPKHWKNWIIIAVYSVFIICAVVILPITFLNIRNS
ncbi:MAG: hypothetical protein K8R02_06775 [Anaerohalosphaeraceae bacterium]|nr:hypothetical protein [Anaerohalosphaeraceae bacterium]